LSDYPHDGYFSVSGRGEYGHWDISDGRQRVFKIRGDKATGFVLIDERSMAMQERIDFDTPFEAMLFASRQLIVAQTDEKPGH